MLAKLLLNHSTNSKGAILVRLLVLGGLTSLAASIASSSAYSQQFPPEQSNNEVFINIAIIDNEQKNYYFATQHFATQLEQLKTRVPAKTSYYIYKVASTKGNDSTQAVVTNQALPLPNRRYLKAVINGVIAVKTGSSLKGIYSTTCLATLSLAQGGPSGDQLITVTSAGILRCPDGYKAISGIPQRR